MLTCSLCPTPPSCLFRQRYYYFGSVLQLQTLLLVVVEVFGRAMPVYQQALLLLAVLLAVALANSTTSPRRFVLLTRSEFGSLGVLSLTITLGLFFAVKANDATSRIDQQVRYCTVRYGTP